MRTSLLNDSGSSFSGSFSGFKESDALMSVNNGGLNYGATCTNDNDVRNGIALNDEATMNNIKRNDLIFNKKDLGIVVRNFFSLAR